MSRQSISRRSVLGGAALSALHAVPASADEKVAHDPRECTDLLAARPEDAARLSTAWEAWNATVLPELPPPSAG